MWYAKAGPSMTTRPRSSDRDEIVLRKLMSLGTPMMASPVENGNRHATRTETRRLWCR